MTQVQMKILVVSMLLSCFAATKAQTANTEQLTVVLSKPGKPLKLAAGLQKGMISVAAYDGKEVLVEAELLPEKGSNNVPNQNQNTNTNANTNRNEHTPPPTDTKTTRGKYITATENNNNVLITANNAGYKLRVQVKVPQNSVALKLSVANEGSITATDIAGELEINNTNGSIALTNIAGSVLATTVTGNITTTFKSVNEKSPMAFSTLAGKIDVCFPSSLKAALKVQSDAGALYSDYDISFDGVKPFVTKVNLPCLYQIKPAESLTGSVNGGGPEIFLKTMQGDIYIRKAK